MGVSIKDKDSFFNELQEWSERKLQLLEKYLDPATKIMSRIWYPQRITRVYYVDGFAGVGTYKDGSKGSPVRAAELARQYQGAGKSYSLKCVNVEEDRANFTNLQRETSHFGNLVLNLFGSFASNIGNILQEIGKVPAVCFLDPFGVEGLDWDAVYKVIQRNTPTDFWIRFDAEYVLRLDGFHHSMAPEAPRKLDILTRTYGINSTSLIHGHLIGPTPEVRKQKAVDLYLDQLRSAFKQTRGEGFAAAYLLKSLDEEDKYYLVFASANKKAFVLASNIVYGIEETYQRELQEYKANNTVQATMFDALALDPTEEEIFLNKVADLKRKIWQLYQGKQDSRLNIHAHLISKSNWFGRIKARHMTSAFKSLVEEGKIILCNGTVGDEDCIFTFRN